MALVLPPTACSRMTAFSNDSRERISLGLGIPVAASLPVTSAICKRRDELAGAVAVPSGARPRASVRHAMVLAVPMTPHV